VPDIQLSLFNEFRITLLPDREIPSRVKKQAALLAYLVLEDRTTHQREQLASMFWPDLESGDARNNLRVCLTRIRKNLQMGNETGILTTRSSIGIDPNASFKVDVQDFRECIKQTELHEHATRASCSQCHQQLTDALAHYQGEFLKNLSLDDCEYFEQWRLQLQQKLRSQAIDALEDCAEYLQNAGDYAGSEHFTRWQISLDSLRESAHRRLMRLLFFMNNRTGALTHYTNLTDLLLDELGVGPDTETRNLYAQIESGEFEKPVQITAEDCVPDKPGNLPTEITRYIGNENVLHLLSGHLQRYQLLTITGLGGVGKTRLALQLGRRTQSQFECGVYFVSLAALQTAREITAEIATTLSVEVDAGSNLIDQLHSYLRTRRILLVLDNFEHVMAARELVSGLLAATSHLKIIITSRQKLMISGEAAYPLQGLSRDRAASGDVSAAAALFLEAASRVRLDFEPNANDFSAIHKICEMVDGHPLALELAAGWLESLTCAEIAQELLRGSDILTSELADVPDRQRSVDAACQYSWKLLSDDEQHLFASLSIFSGSFDRAAVESITQASVAQLSAMVTRSLVQHLPANTRYNLHGLMRQFASKRLAEYDRADHLRTAHSHYYLRLIETRETEIDDRQNEQNAVALDFDNIRGAWQHALHVADLDRLRKSINGLRKLCLINGREHELIGFIEPLIELTNAHPEYKERFEDFELNLLLALGVAYRNSKGYTDPALAEIFQRARVLSENIDTSAELFAVLYGLWSFNLVRGKLDECLKIIEQWRRRLKKNRTSEPVLIDAAFVVHLLEGPVLYAQGDFHGARQSLESGIRLDTADRRAAIVATYGLDFSISGRFWLSQAQCISGYLQQGLETAHEMELLAAASSQALAHSFSELGMCIVSDLLQLTAGVTRHATMLTNMSLEHRVGQYFVQRGKMFQGSLACQENATAGIRLMQQCFDKSDGSRLYFDSDSLLLTRALLDTGQLTLAAETIDQSLEMADATGVRIRLAETHLLQAELHILNKNTEAAIISFTKSINIAVEQGARLFELRTCLQVCELTADHDLARQALQRLRNLNGHFAAQQTNLSLAEQTKMSRLISLADKAPTADSG